MSTKRLTDDVLRRMIAQEKRRLVETLELQLKRPEDAHKKAREVKADDYANTLEAKFNHYNAMKLQETELLSQYMKLREARERLKTQLLKALK
jgi:hypothetical protein